MPGTEIAFDDEIVSTKSGYVKRGFGSYDKKASKVGRFRQIKKDDKFTHHDALELPDGEIVPLHWLKVGQKATVLQLPATPKTAEEAEEQERLEVVA